MQPTSRKPKRAAQYYNIMREECAWLPSSPDGDVPRRDRTWVPRWGGCKKFKRYAKNPAYLAERGAQLRRREPTVRQQCKTRRRDDSCSTGRQGQGLG